MTAVTDRIMALSAEIARLEGTVSTEAHAIEALRRELAALQADLRAVPQPPVSAADSSRKRPDADPVEDPDGDLFDDVPV
jgi:hypothetical protein